MPVKVGDMTTAVKTDSK
nr:hyp [Cotesia vestalis bracovirus]